MDGNCHDDNRSRARSAFLLCLVSKVNARAFGTKSI